MPSPRAATLMRSASRPVITCLNPSFSTPPIRFSAGTGKSRKFSSQVSTLLYPNLSMSRLTVKPGAPFSITKALIPRCGGSVRGRFLASNKKVLPYLPFVTHIFVPVTFRRSIDILQIRTRARLGKTNPPAPFTRRQSRQESILLIGCSETNQHIAQHRMRSQHSGQPQPAARKLLEDHGECREVDFRAAVNFWNIQSEQPHLPHLVHQRVRIFVPMFHRGRHRNHFFVDELAHRPDHQFLLRSQLFHDASPGRFGTTILRSRVRIASSRWFSPRVATVTKPRSFGSSSRDTTVDSA